MYIGKKLMMTNR